MKQRSSVSEIVEAISNGVEAATPVTWKDKGFCVERGAVGVDLEDWIRDADQRTTRQAIVRINSLPSVGSSLCYVEFEILIEIAYQCEIAEDVRTAMFADDTISIFDSITRNPSKYWGGADSVYPSGPASVEGMFDDTNRPVLFILALPFKVIKH